MRLSLAGLFLVKAIGLFLAGLGLWYVLGDGFAWVGGQVVRLAVALFFPAWAEGVEIHGATLTLLTHLPAPAMAGVPEGQVALLSPEVEFLKYGYGVPLLAALLLASGAHRALAKIALGWLALLPFQAWGVCFDWLKILAIEAGLGEFSPLGRELIALGYQFGYLLLPSLVPILLWAMLDKRFITTFMVEAALDGATRSATKD